jgi:HupE / UreJ protein
MRTLFFFAFMLGLICADLLEAHPMPHSVLWLDVKEEGISAELQWPLKELALAVPEYDTDHHPERFLQQNGGKLDRYLLSHIRITDSLGHVWTISIGSKKVVESEQPMTGRYSELVFTLWLKPPAGTSPRNFIMHYDAIMHQLVTHKLYIQIKRDWDGGLSEEDSVNADLGVLMMNMQDNTIPPVVVHLDEGSKWKGFTNMVTLGIHHIAEGTDHLLFLLVLMLPAPLMAAGKKWGQSGGTRFSLVHLFTIATAFTIGHSLTLLAGSLGWLRLPEQPVETLIASSILIGAVHAFRPVFPGKEMYIALGFGLIHGLAFATTLADLDLDAGRMALSILGFNLGIELMQILVILMFIPWLIILSQTRLYDGIRIPGAAFALVASLSWITERISQKPNALSPIVETIAGQGHWIALGLAAIAVVSGFLFRGKSGSPQS